MHKKQKLLSNSITNIFAKFFNAIIQLISLPLLISVYSKEGYGLIAIAISLNTLISILQLGIPSGLPKFIAEWFAKKDYLTMQKVTSTVFSFYLFLAFVNLSLILIIRFFLVSYFKISPDQIVVLKELLIVTAIFSFISFPVNFLDKLLAGVQELAFISKLQVIRTILFSGLVLAIFLRPNVLTLVQFYVIRCTIMIILVPLKLAKWLKYGTIETFFPKLAFKESVPLLKYCLQLFWIGTLMVLAEGLKPLVLSLRTPANAATNMADYEIIYKLVIFLRMISASFVTALVPYISHEYFNGNKTIYKNVIQKVTKPIWAFGALVVFLLILLSRELLVIYVGTENLYLQKWLVLLLAGSLYILYTPGISAVVIASGRLLPYSIATALASLVSLSVCWYLVPISPLGGMIYSFISYFSIIFVVVHFYYLPSIFNVSAFKHIKNVFVPPLFAGITMFFLIRFLLTRLNLASPYLTIFIGITFGVFLYSVIILLSYVKPREIRALVKSVVEK